MSKAKPARTLRPRHAAFRTSAGGLRLIASDRPFTLASGGAGAGLWMCPSLADDMQARAYLGSIATLPA